MLESESAFIPKPIEGLRLVLPLIHEVRQIGARKMLFQPQSGITIQERIAALPEAIYAIRENFDAFARNFLPDTEGTTSIYDQLRLLAAESGNEDTFLAAQQHAEHAARLVLPSYYETGNTNLVARAEEGFVNTVCSAAAWIIAETNPLLRDMQIKNPFKTLLTIYKQGAYDADTFIIGNTTPFVISFLQRSRYGNRFTYWVEGQGASPFSPLDLPDLNKNPVYAPGATGLRLVNKALNNFVVL